MSINSGSEAELPGAKIPSATYRLQLNRLFTFKDAIEVVPYLASLGISHFYASPILEARPGSMHGYDIVNHKRLNPEIGSKDDFKALVAALRSHNMGLLVDFVPNHMGIGPQNKWWMDVLENGPASPYADYFDIDWSPVKRELEGKVLIPVLGAHYGEVLKNGEIKLSFVQDTGELVFNYYEHRLPVNPVSYTQVLGMRQDILEQRLGESNFDLLEYQSIVGALERLSPQLQSVVFCERARETVVQKHRLSQLTSRNDVVAKFISENIDEFNVVDGDEAAMQRMHKLLEAQAYRLAFWRVASDEINYRRFFDVNDLAAIRTEEEHVFDDIHSFTMELLGEGQIDGIRIDHPDGLYDPALYFRRLQEVGAHEFGTALRPPTQHGAQKGLGLPVYVVVEKILAPFESLPEEWMVHGTTGYDFLDSVNNLLVAEENEGAFTHLYEGFIGKCAPYEKWKLFCKELVLDVMLASELNVLAHRLSRIAESSWFYRDFTLNSLRRALRRLVSVFPVYRSYVDFAGADATDKQYIDWAVALSKRQSSVAGVVYDFIASVLKTEMPTDPNVLPLSEQRALKHAITAFAMKFQQFTSPVTAKANEDTLFYRYVRLVSLNEVGSEPKRFGTSAPSFHRQNTLRQHKTPYGMLATSTHDTKRSEDVRARLAVLSELPTVWEAKIASWAAMNAEHKTSIGEELAPDPNDEYLLYQTIVGALPAKCDTEGELAEFKSRINQYAIKALRESKFHTSWIFQNLEYEKAVESFIDALLGSTSQPFFQDMSKFTERLIEYGYINSLTQTLLKMTSPGVPDVYQGNELWDFSLVDPDNRRPVDFKLRQRYLAEISKFCSDLDGSLNADARCEFIDEAMKNWHDGRLKLLVSLLPLHWRRVHPGLFDSAEYIPLNVTGEKAGNVVAYARLNRNVDGGPGKLAVVVVPLKVASLLKKDDPWTYLTVSPITELSRADVWTDTAIELPEETGASELRNIFTGERVMQDQNLLLVSKLFGAFPVAMLCS